MTQAMAEEVQSVVFDASCVVCTNVSKMARRIAARLVHGQFNSSENMRKIIDLCKLVVGALVF